LNIKGLNDAVLENEASREKLRKLKEQKLMIEKEQKMSKKLVGATDVSFKNFENIINNIRKKNSLPEIFPVEIRS